MFRKLLLQVRKWAQEALGVGPDAAFVRVEGGGRGRRGGGCGRRRRGCRSRGQRGQQGGHDRGGRRREVRDGRGRGFAGHVVGDGELDVVVIEAAGVGERGETYFCRPVHAGVAVTSMRRGAGAAAVAGCAGGAGEGVCGRAEQDGLRRGEQHRSREQAQSKRRDERWNLHVASMNRGVRSPPSAISGIQPYR